jgi:hypothetical protein
MMKNLRKSFYDEVESCFQHPFRQSLPLNDIKDYVKHNFSKLEISKGYIDKIRQKHVLASFNNESVDLPIYKGSICMQLSGLFPNLWLDFQRMDQI